MQRIASILVGLLVVLGWPGGAFAGQTASGQEVVPAANPGAANEQTPLLSEAEFREFLKTAKVVASKQTSKGITAPVKLTLSDGQRTLAACFQAINENKAIKQLDTGTEIGFRDSYRFNIAAFELAKMLGIGDMVPATLEYKWKGETGSLTYWVPFKLDELERNEQGLQSPDMNAWNKQVNRMWVFSELIADTDRNRTNMLITEDWKLWIIDFTRAFRLKKTPLHPEALGMCDRQLLEALRQLDEAQVCERTKPYIGKKQVRALISRRDKIVQHFETLIAQKGESAVLY